MAATDAQVGALADILRNRAHKTGEVVYSTPREGLDVVVLPDEEGTVDVVWADRSGVACHNKDNKYRLRSGWTKGNATYKTDLRNSPSLEDTPESREYFEKLFKINSSDVLGRLMGWYLACFASQAVRHLRRQFPMVQVYGPAGAGKTKTNELMASLHYWRTPVLIHSASGQTKFSLENLLTSSASIPLILDEFKPREMRKDDLERLKRMIRGNYIGETISKGSVSHESGQSVLESRGLINVAPIVAIGEALESQTAIMHRTVMVHLTAESKQGHSSEFLHCQLRKEYMSMLGKACLETALNFTLDSVNNMLTKAEMKVAAAVGEGTENSDRQVFNMAVVLLGLEFGKWVMQQTFGDTFDKNFEAFEETILGQGVDMIAKVRSEATKVMGTLTYLSHIQDENERSRLVLGEDYLPEGGEIHLNLRNAYAKYVRYQRSLGEEALYDNVEAFTAAMSTYAPVRNRNPIDSALKLSPTTLVYSFDMEALSDENAGEFRV